MTQMTNRIWDSLTTFWPIELIDSGLADVLCLKTYEHGTSPSSYNSILKYGVDPSFGGSGGKTALDNTQKSLNGEQIQSETRTLGNFYVVDHQSQSSFSCYSLGSLAKKYTLARSYAIVSSISDLQEHSTSIFRKVAGFFLGQAVPTIKLRFTQQDSLNKFNPDSIHEDGVAAYTTSKITTDHIGLSGTLIQGLNKSLAQRIKQNPAQFTLGILKIIAAIAIVTATIILSAGSHIVLCVVIGYISLKAFQALAQFIVPLLSGSKDLQTVLRQKTIVHNLLKDVGAAEKPLAILMSGCSGSGKSVTVNQILEKRKNEFVHLDSDQILLQIPEYQKALANRVQNAASIYFRESIKIRNAALYQAISQNKSIIYDSTGSHLEVYEQVIKELKRHNYRIELMRCEITLEETLKRVRLRNAQTGRVVPDEVVKETFVNSQSTFEVLKTLVDKVTLVE